MTIARKAGFDGEYLPGVPPFRDLTDDEFTALTPELQEQVRRCGLYLLPGEEAESPTPEPEPESPSVPVVDEAPAPVPEAPDAEPPLPSDSPEPAPEPNPISTVTVAEPGAV